jgi:hypothetical protein
MRPLTARIEGIGFWANALPTWAAACEFARSGALAADAPARPQPQLRWTSRWPRARTPRANP